jgi:DNA helicase II / ATP-dependent DNA helicase PcrA
MEVGLRAQCGRWLHALLGAGTSAELEEERRLLYVAMTRAKDDLHLVVPQRFFTHGQHAQGDRHAYASRTRWIPDRLLGLFEKTVWPRGS